MIASVFSLNYAKKNYVKRYAILCIFVAVFDIILGVEHS